MKGVTKTVLILLCAKILCFADICKDTKWKKIELKDVLIFDFVESIHVMSAEKCAELCAAKPWCKSFGISSIFTTSMDCFLYRNRVWTRQVLSNSTGLGYYWLLEDVCPIDKGYAYNTSSNICAKMSTYRTTWTNALYSCEVDGGYLGVMNSNEKKDMFFDLINGTDQSVFVGSTNLYIDPYTWLDGSDIQFWKDGEPNNLSGEHCGGIRFVLWAMNDIVCDHDQYFVCEIPMF